MQITSLGKLKLVVLSYSTEAEQMYFNLKYYNF